jgi:hypothetical protein
MTSSTEQATYHIFSSENVKDLPFIVFWTRSGKTERARHLGRRGTFNTYAEAERAVHNATRYGTQKV